MLLRGQTGGEAFIARRGHGAANADRFATQERPQTRQQSAMRDRAGERVAVLLFNRAAAAPAVTSSSPVSAASLPPVHCSLTY